LYPFIYHQHNNFEFSKPMQFGASNNSSKPATFSSLLSKQADSACTPNQRPAPSEEPVTPGSVVSESKATPSADAAAAATPRGPIVWSDILLWKEPLQSLAIFVAGLLAFGVFTFAAYGAHKMTLVSGACRMHNFEPGKTSIHLHSSRNELLTQCKCMHVLVWVEASDFDAACSSCIRQLLSTTLRCTRQLPLACLRFAQPLLPAGLSYLLLADLFANFFRYFVSKPWHDKCLWGGAAQMKHVLTRINAGMLHLAAAHDKYQSAEKPGITLKVRLQAHCSAQHALETMCIAAAVCLM
jgi:hypothetical protein